MYGSEPLSRPPKPASSEPSLLGCAVTLVVCAPFALIGYIVVHEWNKMSAEHRLAEQKAAAEAPPAPPVDPTFAACDLTATRIKLMGSHAVEGSLRWQLKAPGSATFSGYESSFVLSKNCTIEMDGWVDAQNSFGATIRTPWTARLRGRGSDFSVLEARLLN